MKIRYVSARREGLPGQGVMWVGPGNWAHREIGPADITTGQWFPEWRLSGKLIWYGIYED
jgi:hypothetical protein